jgi:Domain of unknown function (DUF4340)/Type II secretion system (T2SS), protein G
MNEIAKTIAFLGAAALFVALASITGPGKVENALFDDEGQVLFPDFTDAGLASELEVTSRDETGALIRTFNVKRDQDGIWTIPSHSGYPADAQTRMAKSATMMLGLRRDRVISDLVDDHAKCGVRDPEEQSLDTQGRGLKVTFKSAGGQVLASLIIGKELESDMDMQFVRLPDKKRVYAARFDNQLSTKFADWIETDLLKAKSWDIAKVVFDNYSIDEQRLGIVPGDRIVAKKDDASKWVVEGLADDKETNEDKVREVAETLGQVKIVGVRRKPEGLDARLRKRPGDDDLESLHDMGFFPLRDGSIRSNEGDLLFETKSGIRYTLRFGEIVYGEGDAVTSGGADAKPKQPKEGEQGPQPMAGNNRYLMVSAEFDESLLQKPAGLRMAAEVLDQRRDARSQIEAIVSAIDAYKAKNEGKLPAALADLTKKPNDTDPALLGELKQDPWGQDFVYAIEGEGYKLSSKGPDQVEGGEGIGLDLVSTLLVREDDLKRDADQWVEFDKKVEAGKQEADDLTGRFGPWYYVIDNALFTKLKPTRADLSKAKEAAPATPQDGSAPVVPGLPVLPGVDK